MPLRRAWIYPALGIAIACLGVVQQLGSPGDKHLAVALCACLVAAGAVAVLPSAPLVALGVMLVLDAGYQIGVADPPFATFLATMVAMYRLARAGTRRMMIIGYGATFTALAVMDVVVSARGLDSPANVIIPLVYFGLAGGIGALVRHSATYARMARERAEAFEREQEHLAEIAAAAERARIARELHDVISHSVSLMVLQAEAAREVLNAQPAQAAQTLDTIGDTGRRAIGDLRHLLGVLRSTEEPPPADLGALLEPVRRTGLDIALVESGQPIPDQLRPTAYRIVQEALTNTLKHAAATRITVTVTRDDGTVTLEVVDDGLGAARPAAGGGRGLAGMAERVHALGGTLSAQHVAPQGFRVYAQLPVAP